MSAGLGLGGYGLSVFGQPTDDPYTLAPAKIGSARNIDAKTRRYVVADDGGFEAMDETAQRVLNLVAFGVKLPPFVTPQGEAELDQNIREALAIMTGVRDPDIALDPPSISHDRATQYVGVRYKNLRTGTFQYVRPR
jgi:hypothetical protein